MTSRTGHMPLSYSSTLPAFSNMSHLAATAEVRPAALQVARPTHAQAELPAVAAAEQVRLHFCSTKSQPYVITVVFKFLCRCNGYRGLRVVRIGVESLAYGVLEHHAPSLIHLNGRAAIPKASRWRPF